MTRSSFSDGRTLGVPLALFPRLLRGTRDQREAYRISSRGLHWKALDEDISLAGWLDVATWLVISRAQVSKMKPPAARCRGRFFSDPDED
jgi:Protein of unknown function (DUF2442)